MILKLNYRPLLASSRAFLSALMAAADVQGSLSLVALAVAVALAAALELSGPLVAAALELSALKLILIFQLAMFKNIK